MIIRVDIEAGMDLQAPRLRLSDVRDVDALLATIDPLVAAVSMGDLRQL